MASVTISDGYQLCGACGEVLVNGDAAISDGENFYHLQAGKDCAVPPREWDAPGYKAPEPFLPAPRCSNIGCCGNPWVGKVITQDGLDSLPVYRR